MSRLLELENRPNSYKRYFQFYRRQNSSAIIWSHLFGDTNDYRPGGVIGGGREDLEAVAVRDLHKNNHMFRVSFSRGQTVSFLCAKTYLRRT